MTEPCDICGYESSLGLIEKENGIKICNICQMMRNFHTMDIEKKDKNDNKFRWLLRKIFRSKRYKWNQ